MPAQPNDFDPIFASEAQEQRLIDLSTMPSEAQENLLIDLRKTPIEAMGERIEK